MAFLPVMQDKRLTKRLTDYWDRLRKDAVLPQWEKFNPGAFDDIWKQCCGWRVEPGGTNSHVYTYEYVGSAVKQALGSDPTGQMFTSHFKNFPGARIVQGIDEVVSKKAPHTDEGQFINEDSKVVKYRSCLLPFGKKDGKVTHIVLGLSWGLF